MTTSEVFEREDVLSRLRQRIENVRLNFQGHAEAHVHYSLSGDFTAAAKALAVAIAYLSTWRKLVDLQKRAKELYPEDLLRELTALDGFQRGTPETNAWQAARADYDARGAIAARSMLSPGENFSGSALLKFRELPAEEQSARMTALAPSDAERAATRTLNGPCGCTAWRSRDQFSEIVRCGGCNSTWPRKS
jgi:hypothetical protein